MRYAPANLTAAQSVGLAEDLYLELLKKCLTRSAFPSFGRVLPARGTLRRVVFDALSRLLAKRNMVIVKLPRENAGDVPDGQTAGETMIGLPRLDNLQACVADVLHRDVPGDFIETGVWRGGAAILMRAMLKVFGDTRRTVWAADSFEGLPRPDPERYPSDAGDTHWKRDIYAVSLAEVKANFARYGLLDRQVRFLKGWFKDTLPAAPIDRIAVLRLDGDIYESTMNGLQYLYPKVSPGGWVIVDDYGAIVGCRTAVDDYRRENRIDEPLNWVDDPQKSCVFWQKST